MVECGQIEVSEATEEPPDNGGDLSDNQKLLILGGLAAVGIYAYEKNKR